MYGVWVMDDGWVYKVYQSIIVTKMTNNHSYFQGLVQDLLKAKPNNYSEQCISYYLDQLQVTIEDLPKVHNHRHQRLKCTLIKHRHQQSNGPREHSLNQQCIVYLHGLGSSRLEALTIAQALPKHYCLCMFDMSGGGKSQGTFLTYGLKQQEDIQPVLNYLNRKKHIKEFVLWGRSMGAVATLLYAQQHYQAAKRDPRGILSSNHSLRNSMVHSKSVTQCQTNALVKAIVLDSPFHNFKDIAKDIATKKMGMPNFILDIALNYVDQSFSKLLGTSIGPQYNPFNINFNTQIRLSIPIIILHSEQDEVVPLRHSQNIIRHISSTFQKIPINGCTHNQARPSEATSEVFRKLDKFSRHQHYEIKKTNESMSRDMTISYSAERKRGIFVYTPSKEKDRRETLGGQQSFSLLRETIEYQTIQTEDILPHSPRSRTSVVRKNPVGLKVSRKSRDLMDRKFELISTDNFFSNLNTIDSQTTKILNKKLAEVKNKESGIARIARSKRLNNDRRKEIKLTHQRYLE